MRGVPGSSPPCDRADCDRPQKGNGLCQLHYDRERHRHRKPTSAAVLRRRARTRALQSLARLHPDEFRSLLAEHERIVKEENRLLRAEARAQSDVVLLRPGPRPDDQEPIDRMSLTVPTTFCSHCSTYHASDHMCPECVERDAELLDSIAIEEAVQGNQAAWGRLNEEERSEVVRQLTAVGYGVPAIAYRVGTSKATIYGLLRRQAEAS